MRTIFEGKQTIYNILKDNKVINGKVYKDKREVGSTKEDIVINSLPMTNDDLQDGTFNVNCYVPYIQVKSGSNIMYQPNNARMGEIAKAIIPMLHRVVVNDCNMVVENHTIFEEDSEKTNYINIRVQMYLY